MSFIFYITNQFDKILEILKIIILILLLIIFDLLYYFISKKKFKRNYIIISIISNILELFYFRTTMIIFLNLFYNLPNIYYLISLLFLIPHLYLIINHFIYNHLFYFVPRFIDYPFDEFTSIFDIVLLFEKIFLSIAANTDNSSLGKFCFFNFTFRTSLFLYFLYL